MTQIPVGWVKPTRMPQFLGNVSTAKRGIRWSCVLLFLIFIGAGFLPITTAKAEDAHEGLRLVREARIQLYPRVNGDAHFPLKVEYQGENKEIDEYISKDCIRLGAICGPKSAVMWMDDAGIVKVLFSDESKKNNRVFVYSSVRTLDFNIAEGTPLIFRFQDWKSNEPEGVQNLFEVEATANELLFVVKIEEYLPTLDGGLVVDDNGQVIGEGRLLLNTSINIETAR